MRNGEGAERAAITVTTTSQLQLQLASEEELDDAASSDNNSFSFEEEEGSEFERYCSANSAMGTASLSSSMGTCNDFLDSDSASIKSLGFGRSSFFGEGNNSKRRIQCKAQEEQDIDDDAGYNNNNGVHCRGEASWRLKNWSNSFRPTSSSLMGMGFPSSEQSNTGLGTKPSPQTSFIDTTTTSSSHLDNNKYDENEFNSLFEPRASQAVHQDSFSEQHEHVDFSRLTSEAASCLFDGNHSVQYEETSFRPQHSDDDGSLCSYGTDDERRTDLYEKINSHYWQKPQNAAQNPLHINSAVAFGSEDWDEFIQESEHNSLGAIPLHKFQEKQQTHTQGVLVNSASKAPKANLLESELEQIMRNGTAENCPLNNTNEYKEGVGSRLAHKDLLTHEANKRIGLNIIHGALQHTSNDEVNRLEEGDTSEKIFLRNSKLQDPLSDITTSHPSSSATEELHVKEAVLFEGHEVNVRPPALDYTFNFQLKTVSADSHTSVDQVEAHRANLAPIKVGNPGSNESYDEVVLEMEEILLDSTESHGARFPQSSTPSLAYISQPFRDGSSTASTSGTKEVYSLSQHSVKVDWIEVVGAKQQKGDVSFGERLVGVKEYTMYLIKVWSGKDQWEIERRYRDFFTLYRQLKRLFADHGWVLPVPWSRVEQESRKIFGNASPDVVSQRSILIQECLRSILYSGCPASTHSVLVWFLSPQKVSSSPSMLKTLGSVPELAGVSREEDVSTLGKTISLLVGIQPKKSVKQLLEAQHYCCAGCHKRLDTEKTLVREFVQTLGWGKPRLCEYTGQLFCASCHTNDIAVLPAKVLHFWDFTEYPVSQLAKSYLESIFDQPMLCASAVNPFLFSKVPALLHVMNIRKKIGAMMPYVRCPFRRSIQRGVGSRRYLLEINEFFALRDLVDLSKGAFSGLPVMVETIFEKILEHITQQCLVCCDVGIPCGARQACEDPSSLIFPFQEDEVERCSYCQIAFHKPCFRLLSQCPCGAKFKRRDGAGPSCQENVTASSKLDETLDISPGKTASVSSLGFLSNLFSKATQDKLSGVKKSNPIIPMGSLPSTFSDPL